jgi:hypothetical protein
VGTAGKAGNQNQKHDFRAEGAGAAKVVTGWIFCAGNILCLNIFTGCLFLV